MFKILKGVSVNGGVQGWFAGGGIYNMSCSLGMSGEPTKVTLNIVAENESSYSPPSPNITSGGLHYITVSDGTSGGTRTIHRLYPYKYAKVDGAGSKTMTISFVDQGAAFDKVFVGLTARHAPVDGATNAFVDSQFNFSVRCLECNNLWPRFEQKQGNVTRTLLEPTANNVQGPCRNGGIYAIDGGYCILGKEQWTDGNCEIPPIKYNFTDLLNAVGTMGFNVDQLRNFNRSNDYTAEYSGTLKEVLNSWAADFCFSFAIDPFNQNLTIVADDLTNPVGLGSVRTALAGDFFKGSGNLIRSKNESVSLEGSFSQAPILKNIKPARGFSRNQTSYAEVDGKPLTVNDAIGKTAHAGRSDDQLNISMALAKYHPQVRLIWLSWVAANQWKATGKGPFPSLGFIPATGGLITDVKMKQSLLRNFGARSMGGDIFNHPVWGDPDNYDIFIGVWNDKEQANMEKIDQDLAEFLGKHAYFTGRQHNLDVDNPALHNAGGVQNPPPSYRECPMTQGAHGGPHKYYDYATQISTLPNGDYYKLHSYPFKNILRSNGGVFHLTQGGGVGEGDYIFPLEDNAWGTDMSWVDKVFSNQWVMHEAGGVDWDSTGDRGNSQASAVTDLEHYLPIYARFNSNRELSAEFRDILPNFDLDFLGDSNKRLKGYFPGIAIIPKMDKMKAKNLDTGKMEQLLTVSYDSGANETNPKVYDNARRRALQHLAASKSEKSCIIYCEEDIVGDICKCPDVIEPLHRFKDNHMKAASVRVSHLGANNFVKLIFPVMSDYGAYWKADMVWRGTYPKLIDIKGTPVSSPGNVMESRIVDHDVTGAMDQEPTANGFEQQYIVGGAVTSDINVYAQAISDLGRSYSGFTETINLKVDGVSTGTLPISPAAGLTSYNISVDGEGMSTDLTFSSRPPKLPKKNVFIQQFNALKANAGIAVRHGSNTPTFHLAHNMPFQPMGGGMGAGGQW